MLMINVRNEHDECHHIDQSQTANREDFFFFEKSGKNWFPLRTAQCPRNSFQVTKGWLTPAVINICLRRCVDCKEEKHFFRFTPFTPHTEPSRGLTIAEDGEPQEGQVALSLDGVPAQVGVTFGYQHGTTLEAAAGQVRHHLNPQFYSHLCQTSLLIEPKL